MALRFIFTSFLLISSLFSVCQNTREIYFSVEIGSCDLKLALPQPLTDHAILKLPPSYSHTGKPTRLVYMAHGAGGGVTSDSWFLNQFELQNLLLENGYAVFDVNGGRLENMGGEFVVASAYSAWQHIVQHYNVFPQIIVGGFSMGGLSSTNFVYEHSALVLAHVMYSPVLDLYAQAWKNPWLKSTRKAVAEVYKFEKQDGSSFDSCAITNMNPIARNTFHADNQEKKLYPVPVRIWHGTGDRVVTVESSRRFRDAIRLAGGNVDLTEIDSDDHALSCGNPDMNRELLTFLKHVEMSVSGAKRETR